MRLSSALTLLAATGALAFDWSSLARRNPGDDNLKHLAKRTTPLADLMIVDLNNITAQTKDTTTAIVAATDLNTAVAITAKNTVLLEAIAKAQQDVSSNPANLTDADTQALGAPTQYLAYAANASIGNLILKKALFVSLGIGPVVVSSLQQQQNASVGFSDRLLAKIPEDIRPVANALNGQISVSIQMGIDCYQGKNESCSPYIVDPTRTEQAAKDSGAIPKGAASGRSVGELSGWLVGSAAVAVAVLLAA